MKKNYITPSTVAVKLTTCAIIAVSTNSISNSKASAGSESETVNFSRHSSSWDDEEE